MNYKCTFFHCSNSLSLWLTIFHSFASTFSFPFLEASTEVEDIQNQNIYEGN